MFIMSSAKLLWVKSWSPKYTTLAIHEWLTLKALITTAADDILILFIYFSVKIRIGILCELSAL